MLLDHVDLRVGDFNRTRALYDAILPAMGYTRINAGDESAGYHLPGETGAEPFLWIVSDTSHRPNGTRIALAARDRAEVNRLAEIARSNGATAFEPPALIEEYGAKYYATFFEDAEGNKLEICCRR